MQKKMFLKVLTVWMVFKLESIIASIIIICVKMNEDIIAWGYLAGWKWITTIFSNLWWCIGATIINGQRITTFTKIALFYYCFFMLTKIKSILPAAWIVFNIKTDKVDFYQFSTRHLNVPWYIQIGEYGLAQKIF